MPLVRIAHPGADLARCFDGADGLVLVLDPFVRIAAMKAAERTGDLLDGLVVTHRNSLPDPEMTVACNE